MISKSMQDAINEQMKHEFYSSYLYLSMAAYFADEGWDGMAGWMHKQANEEKEHFMKFFNYLVEREGRVELSAIDKPKHTWESPLDAFKESLTHEKFITSKIHELYHKAEAEKDTATKILLEWYVDEQVEEEASVSKVVQMLERVGDHMAGMYMLDAQLGKR